MPECSVINCGKVWLLGRVQSCGVWSRNSPVQILYCHVSFFLNKFVVQKNNHLFFAQKNMNHNFLNKKDVNHYFLCKLVMSIYFFGQKLCKSLPFVLCTKKVIKNVTFHTKTKIIIRKSYET